MPRHLPQPLSPGVLVGRIGLACTDIDPARKTLMEDRLLMFLKKLDQPFLGADVAPDTPVGVVQEAGNGGLFGERGDSDREFP